MMRYLFLVGLMFPIVLGGCLKPEAIGSNHEIVVVVSPATWDRFENTIRSLFGRTVVTPQVEQIFSLRIADPEDFDFFQKFKNILLLAPLRGEDPTVALIGSLISGEVRTRVLAGRAYMFQKRDIWAREQTLTILTGEDETALEKHLRENGEEIFETMEADLNEKVKAWLYEEMEQKKIEEKLLGTYGWAIRVPRDYWIDGEFPEERFLFFRKTVPDRWLFVYWEDARTQEVLTEAWCLGKRAEIGATHYNGDAIVEEYTSVTRERFLEWEAYRISGLWQNETPASGYAAGGPFRSYCFYDEANRRIYMIDIAVFAPGMSKEPYLRQLDVIAHTFRTGEAGKDR
ncbi:MAG: DUF4837 family protein [Gemmatimonadota bacterium]|nr:MAG: DUF4837 family protein [Gemmatimonadota bacterium]